MVKEHPFLTGAGVGALGLLVWLKRGWFIGMFRRATSVFHGFGDAGVPGALTAIASGSPDAGSVAVRQIRRYAFASSQDTSPVVGITHASYALILLDTAEEMLGRDGLKKITGADPAQMRQFVAAQQDRHAEALRQCDPYLLQVLKLERDNTLSGGAAPRGA